MKISPEYEPIDARRMTPARRAKIIAHHKGACAYPDCGVTEGLEIDHTIALELGGKDRDDNLRPLCGPHHKAKTRLDIKLIAKARRNRLNHTGQRKASARQIRSNPVIATRKFAPDPRPKGQRFGRPQRALSATLSQVRERRS